MNEQRRTMIRLAVQGAARRYMDAALRRAGQRRPLAWLEGQFAEISTALVAEIGEIVDTTEAPHAH